MSSTEVPPKALKRLGFVHDAANYAHGYTLTADRLYRRVRSAVPQQLQPTLSSVEETVASYAVPAVTRAQDAGEKVLHFADDQVDYVVNKAGSVANTSKATIVNTGNNAKKLHANNTKVLWDTIEWHKEQVQNFTTWASVHLNPIKAGQAALEALSVGFEKAKAATDPDVAAKIFTDTWEKFASVPVVHKLLETADPATKAAFNTFYKLHDNVVSWTLYKKAVETGASTLNWATHTTPYKLGAQYIYPIVQPVADPALDKITSSKVINNAVGYWKPTILTS